MLDLRAHLPRVSSLAYKQLEPDAPEHEAAPAAAPEPMAQADDDLDTVLRALQELRTNDSDGLLNLTGSRAGALQPAGRDPEINSLE